MVNNDKLRLQLAGFEESKDNDELELVLEKAQNNAKKGLEKFHTKLWPKILPSETKKLNQQKRKKEHEMKNPLC